MILVQSATEKAETKEDESNRIQSKRSDRFSFVMLVLAKRKI